MAIDIKVLKFRTAILNIASFVIFIATVVALGKTIFSHGKFSTFLILYFLTATSIILTSFDCGTFKETSAREHPLLVIIFFVIAPVILSIEVLVKLLRPILRPSKKVEDEIHEKPKKNSLGKRRSINGHYFRRGDEVSFNIEEHVPIKGIINRTQILP